MAEFVRLGDILKAAATRLAGTEQMHAYQAWAAAAGERLAPVPGGDEVRAPVNLAALGSDTTGTAPDGAGRPSGQNVPGPVAKPGAGESEDEKALAILSEVQGLLKKAHARRRGEDANANLLSALSGEIIGLDQPVN